MQRNRAGEGKMINPEMNRNDYELAIYQWILGRNGERDRKILSMYLFDGITYEEMQRRLDDDGCSLSIDQLKKIIRHRKAQLFSHI